MPSPADVLKNIQIHLATSIEDRLQWDEVMAREHYLRSSSMMGEQLRYIASLDGEWMGLLGWSSATLSSANRRRWVGWTLAQERQRLHLVAQNARFLIRGENRIPNLASRLLGLNAARLSRDWSQVYAHGVVVAETFVDAQRYQGTCYRAAGWQDIGCTGGHGRMRVGYQVHGESRMMLMKELVPHGRAVLCADHHVADRSAFLTLHEIALTGADGLLAYLREHIHDPRSRRGRSFQCATVLGIIVAGMLTGRKTLERIGAWAATLDQRTLEHFCCPRATTGLWKPPCANSLRYLLTDVDPELFEKTVSGWLRLRGLLGRVPGVSIGPRVHPVMGSQGRPSPWHLRWTRRRATAIPTYVVETAVPAGML